MDLIVNGLPVAYGSMGTRRYYHGVMKHLGWKGCLEVSPVPRWSALRRIHELTRRGRSDAIFWSPAQRGPLRAHHHVVTVLDCINLEYAHRDDWRLAAYRRVFQAILDGAEAVATISRATMDSLHRHYRVDPARATVIPSGCDLPDGERVGCGAEEPPAGRPFVLMVTNAMFHKNTLEACRALARSRAGRRGVDLVLVGSAAPGALEACRAAGIQVHQHRLVDDALLSRLYRSCQFLLAPSLQEGYDLPVAEALLRGANVLCSDIQVHREYFEGRCRMFDPTRLEAIVEALDGALDAPGRWFGPDAGTRTRSFAEVAADYRAIFERIAGAQGRSTSRGG